MQQAPNDPELKNKWVRELNGSMNNHHKLVFVFNLRYFDRGCFCSFSLIIYPFLVPYPEAKSPQTSFFLKRKWNQNVDVLY